MDKSFLQHVIEQDLDVVLNGPDNERRFAAEQLKSSITKKWVDNNDAADKAAVALFRQVNVIVGTLMYDPSSPLIMEMRRLSEHHFSKYAYDFDWQSMLTDSGLLLGAGASSLSRGQNGAFEKLFVNELSTTNPFLYTEYLRYIKTHESFLSAEISRAKVRGHVSLVRNSTFSTVPKTSAISRTIMTEPSLNMIFQRSLAVFIDKLLAKFYGYDSALQPDRNRNLARLGSLLQSTATIDLSSASDFVSMKLVNLVLPTQMCIAIEDCRVSETKIDGETVTLNMVSGMGNGFTFSLQTYVFSLLVEASCNLIDEQFTRFNYRNSKFGVFGDDIIVPDHIATVVLANLKRLGFVPNMDKSFYGYTSFRESCGTDWYNGVNVRGVYCKGLTTDADRYSLINRLVRWSAKHCIDLVETIRSLLPSNWRRYCVPSDLADTAGLKTPRAPVWYRRRPHGFKIRCYTPKKKIFKLLIKRAIEFDTLRESHNNVLGFYIIATTTAEPHLLSRRQEVTAYANMDRFIPYWHVHTIGDWIGYTFWELAFDRHVEI
jgi:hypothetical protein